MKNNSEDINMVPLSCIEDIMYEHSGNEVQKPDLLTSFSQPSRVLRNI